MTRRLNIRTAALCLLWAAGAGAGAQHDERDEHEALVRLSGEYRLTSTFWADAAATPQVGKLTARRRSVLGGRVLELHVEALASEPPFEGRGMTGYDEATGEYWTSWVDTTGSDLTVMRGTLRSDGSGRFEGHRSVMPLRVEIRIEAGKEVHEYTTKDAEGRERRYLQLVYERVE